jgi:hypothetical protein
MHLKYLIKFTKREWANNIKELGELYFNPAYKFFTSSHYSLGQYDQWDSHYSFTAEHICFAPIIEENENGIIYGSGSKLMDKSRMHLLYNRNKKIPICCFRMVYDTEIENGILRIDNTLYEKITNDFPEYDSFALICSPEAFFNELKGLNKFNFMGHSVYYEKESQTCNYYDFMAIKDINKHNNPYLYMFCKETKYSYQQEFRLILPLEQWDEGRTIKVGFLENFVFVGSIKQLHIGYHVIESIKDNMCYYEFEELV